MNSKILAVALAALLVTAGGAAAVGSTVTNDGNQPDTRDADLETSYDDGVVTATVTNDGEPVPNATVEIGDDEHRTDVNGTVTADVGGDDEVDVEVEAPGFEGEHEYAVVDGELLLQEEKFEYDVEADENGGDDDDDDSEETDEDGSDDEDEEDDEDEDEGDSEP